MNKRTFSAIASTFILAAAITSCGSAEEPKTEATDTATEEVTEETTASLSGEEIYTNAGCVACHQPDAKTVGPSIKSIAEAYKENQAGLINFMKGEGEAIVDPAQAALMLPQVEITKAMSNEERTAIADYILSI